MNCELDWSMQRRAHDVNVCAYRVHETDTVTDTEEEYSYTIFL